MKKRITENRKQTDMMNQHQEKYPNLILFGIQRIRPQVRTAFLAALIFGLICHGTILFNKISYQDDIFNLYTFGATITSGRWMLHILAWLEMLMYGNGNASMPLFNGLISILCVGAVSGLLVSLLEIRSRIYSALLGAVLVAFPALTALFAYMFTSHPYMIGLLMMVLSAFLICRETPWWMKIPAVALGGASVGVYQAFLPVLPCIILIYDLMVLSREKERLEAILYRAWGQVFCVLGVLAVYYAGNRFFLAKFQVELSSYMGINEMGSMSVSTMLSRCKRAYREFLLPARGVITDMYPGSLRVLYRMMQGAEGLLALRLFCRIWKRSRIKALLTALLLALFPMACNLIYVMSEDVHSLMVYGQAMQAVLLIWLLDQADFRRIGLQRAVSLAGSLMLALTGLMYARYDNQAYLKDTLRQQQAFSYYTTLITQIKSLEGYRPDMEICVLNGWYTEDPTIAEMEELNFIHLNTFDGGSGSFMQMTREYFLQNWLGFRIRGYWGLDLYENPELMEMPAYPADGSIRIVDDTVVVKFK